MMSIKLIYILGLTFAFVLNCSAEILQPCKVNDEDCITKSAKAAYPQLIAGIPSAGVETSDPLHLKEIIGDLSGLNYVFKDSEVTGFKNCDINNLNLDLDKSSIHCEMTCLNVFIQGDYTIKGQLIILPVEGNGRYNVSANKYKIVIDGDIKKIEGKDGKTHLNIKSFKLDLNAQDVIIYHFDNLFNGQKDLSDAVHKFANENWKEVGEFVQGPVFQAIYKKMISNINKYLKTVPYEDLFLQ